MPDREKGVASAPCPNCGKELLAVEQADGAIAYETCSKCYGAPAKKEVAKAEKEAQMVARERGTDTEEGESA